MVRANFVPDHHYDSKPPVAIETGVIHAGNDSALFAFGDQNVVVEPADLPPAMPEVVTIEPVGHPKDVIAALEKTVKALNQAGKNSGRDKITHAGGNRFTSHYTDVIPRPSAYVSVPGSARVKKPEEQRVAEMADYVAAQRPSGPIEIEEMMDGKEIGLLQGVGLMPVNKPESKKTPADKKREAEGQAVLAVLHDSEARLRGGESQAEVEASRRRFAALILDRLAPGAKRRVDLGDRTELVDVDGKYRNSLWKKPEKGTAFLAELRLRSR